ncbi:MAG: hypothetical protein JSV24_09230 [Bacteroidales bacterium]|nr:MAG: hypothetical protein JSV24_09230 [Bacteroidales bacterium]
MIRYCNHIIWFILLGLSGNVPTSAQEEFYDSLLTEVIEVDNPIYKPVIGFGAGIMNFYGDVTDNFQSISGQLAPKVTISTFLDKARQLKLEFFFIKGVLTGNQSEPGDTLNFKTDISDFGLALHFDFRRFDFMNRPLRPFIGIGLETFQFNSKGDLLDANNQPYRYWPDGTIRDPAGKITVRDYTYETDLREADRFEQGKYPEIGFGIPLDLGVELALSERVSVRLGSSIHFSFSDFVDDKRSDDVGLFGNTGNDIYNCSYVTLHLDLFSIPPVMRFPKFFAEVEFDETMFEDEDGDLVLDFFDQCPETPYGVSVDSLGCPFDGDSDGVPDFMDKQQDTPAGAYVDDEGVELSEEELIAMYSLQDAVKRDEVGYYVNRKARFSKLSRGTTQGVPVQFQSFDTDLDNYISFEELLDAITAFFDFRTFLSKEDMYELINFFFIQ